MGKLSFGQVMFWANFVEQSFFDKMYCDRQESSCPNLSLIPLSWAQVNWEFANSQSVAMPNCHSVGIGCGSGGNVFAR